MLIAVYDLQNLKINFFGSLFFSPDLQVPAVFLLTRYWRDDLVGLYYGMAIGYFALALLYGSIVVFTDWKKYAELARQRSEMH